MDDALPTEGVENSQEPDRRRFFFLQKREGSAGTHRARIVNTPFFPCHSSAYDADLQLSYSQMLIKLFRTILVRPD